MPQKIDLEEIAQKNPEIDLQKLDEWRKLRQILQERGMQGRRNLHRFARQDKRATIIDDAENDPRLVSLKQ